MNTTTTLRSISTRDEDTYTRIVGIYDQLAFSGEPADIKSLVGKMAVAVRDGTASRDALIAYASDAMGRYRPQSMEWAVFGCVLNVLRGPRHE